jgi:glycosyltransferase involved in cell wall biosynthesis
MSSKSWKGNGDKRPRAISTPLPDAPLISIVTPSFNQARFIGEALTSVQSQGYGNYEHIIIDGMSTDGTIEILHDQFSNSDQANVLWRSESDSGQSEALNKGFRLAKGEIIGWLNSDDCYQPNCFEHVARAFNNHPEIDILYGDYCLINESGEVLKIRREIEFNAFILRYHCVLYIPTTATFFRRRVFDENNWLDEKLHYAMDLEFFIRLSKRGYRFMHLSKVLADFRLQPTSKTCTSPDKQRAEHQRITIMTSPLLCNLPSRHLKKIMLSFLQLLAGVKRYSEKLQRGYYWEQLRSSAEERPCIRNFWPKRVKTAVNLERQGK